MLLLSIGTPASTYMTFVPPPLPGLGVNPQFLVVGDFNADGKADLVVGNDHGDGGVLFNNGNGTFREVDFPLGQSVNTEGIVVVGDFDLDGRADLALAGRSAGNVDVLLSNGNGFRSAVNSVVGGYPAALATEDFNGDGRADLVVNLSSRQVSVLLGKGDGTFQPPVNYDYSEIPDGSSGPVVAADFDGNGIADIAAASVSVSGVSVLLGATPAPTSDSIRPTTIVTPSPGPSANGWNNTNVIVTLNATDNSGGSGVKQINFTLGGARIPVSRPQLEIWFR